jgi:molybdopterin-guanine dinucleotide biosynthesis protein A
VTLAVLAGGAGTRMGGPKVWLEVKGRPILEHLLDRFAWPGPTLLVTTPGLERPPGRERFTAEATDAESGEGPLRGVLTALHASRESPYVVVTTVDMPRVGRPQFEWLLDFLAQYPLAYGALPIRRAGGRERVEPFPCVVSGTATVAVAAHLAHGNRAVHSLLPRVFMPAPVPADWPDDVWTNLNHPIEFQRFVASL